MKPSIQPGVGLLLVLYCTAANLCQVSGKQNLQCTCGVPELGERILGGRKAGYNEFPWQALILYGNSLICGGTVINDRYILTAGHCVHGTPNRLLKVVLGAYNKSLRNWMREKAFSINAKKIHRRYFHTRRKTSGFYIARDIALLRLNETIPFNSYIRPVCLPSQGETFDEKSATVIGWGRTKYRGKLSNPLLKTTVRVLSNEKCTKLKRNVANDPSSMLCAYGSKKSSCKGDSGGPLLYMSPNGKTTQIGIVSWGAMCGAVGLPGVYTKVSTFSNWIRKNTKDANYCHQ